MTAATIEPFIQLLLLLFVLYRFTTPTFFNRSEVKSLLAEVPNNTLPLFRFREVFERRFNASISVSDLYRMKDIVTITDENGNGRMISLARDSRVLTDDCGGVSEVKR